MNENLSKVCRICLTEGSRNIFQRPPVAHDALYNVSSLSRISEKLRYVTLLKIDEMENLPPMICDLCIVQLNVAYNFKRQASESDTKLRQYLIENGIDIMKDPSLSLPSVPIITSPAASVIHPPPTLPSILRPVIVEAPTAPPPPPPTMLSRTIQRSNSTASSTVLEICPANRMVPPPQLRPICIKVETPETTTEQSGSEVGDLLSNSEISPLSSATSNPAILVEPATTTDNAVKTTTTTLTVDSSPASSKTSLSDRGSGAMVMVSSENVSMQGDEDFVQNILGSNSSLAAASNISNDRAAKKTETPTNDSKVNGGWTEEQRNKRKDRMKALLSKLTIDMVSSDKQPKTKLRKKQQQHQKVVKTNATKRLRSSLDYSSLFAKRNTAKVGPAEAERRRNPSLRRSEQVISANKLRSLREKIREEMESGMKKVAEDAKRRKTIAFVDLAKGTNGDGPSSSRVSLP